MVEGPVPVSFPAIAQALNSYPQMERDPLADNAPRVDKDRRDSGHQKDRDRRGIAPRILQDRPGHLQNQGRRDRFTFQSITITGIIITTDIPRTIGGRGPQHRLSPAGL